MSWTRRTSRTAWPTRSRGCPEREKLVVALYYYENLTLREIGEVLGVTESRISQLHTKAVLRLRGRLTEDDE
jgi:RNA polymerase sigma factor for flagellar operon FliA